MLPPPLKPVERPIAYVYVANFARTNFGASYMEAALFLRAEYGGVEGGYCLAMPVTNAMAMAGGREIFGFPKKLAEIHLSQSGDKAEAWVERRGVRFLEIRANLTGRFNTPDAQAIIGEVFKPGANAVYYNYKHFPAPDWSGFDYAPRLVRGEVKKQPKFQAAGEAEIALCPSDYDPWREVEPVRLLGAVHSVADSSMLKAEVVAEADSMAFGPYAFLKGD